MSFIERLSSQWFFDNTKNSWYRTNDLLVFEKQVDTDYDSSNWPKRCNLVENLNGDFEIDIRLAGAHRIVATLFVNMLDPGNKAYYYKFPNGEQFRWGATWGFGDDKPCHASGGHNPSYRIMFPEHLKIDEWQSQYDILVLGRIGDIELAQGDWTCQIVTTPSGMAHGTVFGPAENPEGFVSLVELYLTAVQSTPVAIPWMGMHRGDRMGRKGYDTCDTVYIRTVVGSKSPLHRNEVHEHGFRKYMENSKKPEEYFPMFCRVMERHDRLKSLIMEWMHLRTITHSFPTVLEGFTVLRSIVVALEKWPHGRSRRKKEQQHELMNNITSQWNIPNEVTTWIEKNKPDAPVESWYDAIRILRNTAAHREDIDVDWDTVRAMQIMSRDVVNHVCELLWRQIEKIGKEDK